MPDLPPARLPFVWELSYSGILSHAVGTHHVLPYDFREHIDELVKGKSTVFVEHVDTPDSYKAVRERKMQRLPTPAIDQLAPDAAASLAELLGRDVAELRKAPLLALYSLYVKGVIPAKLMQVDWEMEQAAIRMGVRLEGLETLEESLHLLDCALDIFQQRLPDLARCSRNDARLSFGRVVQAYMAGNAQGMLEAKDFTGVTMADVAQQYPELFFPRHQNMVDRSLKYLNAPALIAVGCGHFLVEPSLLTLYKERGVSVQRLQ